MDGKTDRQYIYNKTDRHTQVDGQTDGHRQADGLIERQTGRQTDKLVSVFIICILVKF